MLQQTQVKTVVPYYLKFLSTFPALESLAKAPLESVLGHWSGLGYYSRAKNLHKGAAFILDHYQGKFPKTRGEILKVPGIGPYTAGAILSIAFNLKIPLVDGNVERVFSRYFGLNKASDTKEAKSFFWEKAEALVEVCDSARDFNQGLMELGSLICTKASPNCSLCPLVDSCVALKTGSVDKLPFKQNKKKYQEKSLLKWLFEKEGKIWLRPNSDKEWWSGLWDFPTSELKAPANWFDEAETQARQFRASSWRELCHQKHTVTHHRLKIIPVHLKVKNLPLKGGKWVPIKEIPSLPISSLVRKIMLHDF